MKAKGVDRMLFNEWIKDNSLFTEINNIEQFPFIEQYGATNLDLLYKMKYGSRTVPRSMKDLTVQEVATIIVTGYGMNWNNQYQLLVDDLMLGVESKTVTNEIVSDDETKNIDSNNENKVSAYNDDELSTNDSSSDNLSEDRKRKTDKDTETTRSSYYVAKSQLELFNSSFIMNVICKDVSELISLSIY